MLGMLGLPTYAVPKHFELNQGTGYMYDPVQHLYLWCTCGTPRPCDVKLVCRHTLNASATQYAVRYRGTGRINHSSNATA